MELLLLAVIVLESGVRDLFVGGGEGLASLSSEGRGAKPRSPILERCDSLTDVFADFSASRASLSRPSLFITSAKAFPTEAKFNDCRIELLVEGLRDAVVALDDESEGIVNVRVKESSK
jgi:hypothetical protein